MTDDTLPARYPNGRFGPGNPGRPVGAISRSSQRAAIAILNHFEFNQEEFLHRVMRDPRTYIRLLAHVLPRQVEVDLADPPADADAGDR
jgi:hypothetical protein